MTAGSSTANNGRTNALIKGSLLPSRVTTPPVLDSEPVAGSVNTQPMGRACLIGCPLATKSQGSSPSNKAAAAMNLVPSTTEPPPTANKKSILCSRIKS